MKIALLICECNSLHELQKFQQQNPFSQSENEEFILIDVRLPHLDEQTF